MLQASDHQFVDQLSSFVDAIVHVYCGNDKWADVTSVFTKYVQPTKFASRDSNGSCWNDVISKLQCSGVREFKKEGKLVWKLHHAFGMGTQKCHILDPLADHMTAIRGTQFLPVGLYVGWHKSFSSIYAESSKRKQSTMRAILNQMHNIVTQLLGKSLFNMHDTKSTPAKACAVLKDTSVLTSPGSKTSLASIKVFFPGLFSKRDGLQSIEKIWLIFKSTDWNMEKKWSLSNMSLVEWVFQADKKTFSYSRNTKLLFQTSCYVSATPCLFLLGAMV